MNAHPLGLAALVLLALASSWLALRLSRDDAPPPLVGPPRSDYILTDFELVALDQEGKESFVASGPLLTRHPFLGTLDIDQPRFRVPDGEGGTWLARSSDGWVQSDASQVRLLGDVRVSSPDVGGAATEVRSELIDIFPRERRLATTDPVTITSPGSILRAVGMRADLQTRYVELLSEVRARHEPPRP